jgi:6-phosphogluconolactonase (cycloisomerase 2 family)
MATLVFAGEGCFTSSSRIHSFALDLQSQSLTPLATLDQTGLFPIWMGTDSTRKFLYCVDTEGPATEGLVHSYQIGEDGVLVPIGASQSTCGVVPAHFCIVNNHVVVANYGSRKHRRPADQRRWHVSGS